MFWVGDEWRLCGVFEEIRAYALCPSWRVPGGKQILENESTFWRNWAMETTLIILKPDAVQRGLMGKIITRFEEKGLAIVGMKMMTISQELAGTHYKDHAGKPFYDGLVGFMTSSPVLVMAVRGVGAIGIARSMMGATFGSQADAGTIRGDFGVSNSFNLIHGSDSAEAAAREIGLFFDDGDIQELDRAIEGWVYDMSGGDPE